MTELALRPLVTMSRLIERTQQRLRVHAEWHLLYLHWFREQRLFLAPFLLLGLRLRPKLLLALLRQSFTRLPRLSGLRLDTLDFFLDLGRFVFLKCTDMCRVSRMSPW